MTTRRTPAFARAFASGRGWAALGTAGRLAGHIFIHKGDDSGLVAERELLLQQPVIMFAFKGFGLGYFVPRWRMVQVVGCAWQETGPKDAG